MLASRRSTWAARDGRQLAAKVWRDGGVPARAALILVHGLNGSVDDFEPLVEALAPRGYECFACGLRGQGEDPTPKKRGDLRRWQKLRDDLVDFHRRITGAGKERPVFVFGESMGALIALQAAVETRFDGVIFSSPVVRFRHEGPIAWWQRAIARVLFYSVPWYRLDLRRVDGREAPDPVVTRDEAYLERIRNAPHKVPRFTIGFYRELIRLVMATPTAARQLQTRALVLGAGHDVFVRPEDVEAFFQSLPGPDKTLRLYPESYHLLVRDLDAADVIEQVRGWLDARSVPAYPRP